MNLSPSISLTPSDILWIEGEVNYSRIIFRNRSSILVCKTLKEIENKLNRSSHFIRVHRGYLVNANYLNEIDLVKREVTIRDKVLPIARRRLGELSHLREITRVI